MDFTDFKDGSYKSEIINTIENSLKKAGRWNEPNGTNLINFLTKESDYLTAPASTRFHSCFEGGLSIHSFIVHELLAEKNEEFQLGLSDDTIAICGLLHDVCKCNFYKKGFKNVIEGKKLNRQGKEVDNWVSKEVYVVEDQNPLGHSEKSVFILQKYLILTDLEIAMIRWHMGFTEPKDLWVNYHSALEKYPAVAAMFTSDIEATYIMESGTNGEVQK